MKEMTPFRLLVIALLSLMFKTAVPIAMGSAQAPDVLKEAVHRPRIRTTITLVRDLPSSKAESQVASVHLRPGVTLEPVHAFVERQSVRKTPRPVADPPPHCEEH